MWKKLFGRSHEAIRCNNYTHYLLYQLDKPSACNILEKKDDSHEKWEQIVRWIFKILLDPKYCKDWLITHIFTIFTGI